MEKSKKHLSPQQELTHIETIYGESQKDVMDVIKSHLQILQIRSQTILGMCTICLTITGFSGPRIAETGKMAAACVVSGLFFVVITTLLLVAGPLRLQWITRTWEGDWEKTILFLLERRNRRTKLFTLGSFFLIGGMSFYMAGLAIYLFSF